MIHVELSPEVEARVQSQARAQGVGAESYVRSLIEQAVGTAAMPPRGSGEARDMSAFFEAMAANSDEIPQLPDEAFARESFYSDHD